jgi:hypothetical protein
LWDLNKRENEGEGGREGGREGREGRQAHRLQNETTGFFWRNEEFKRSEKESMDTQKKGWGEREFLKRESHTKRGGRRERDLERDVRESVI